MKRLFIGLIVCLFLYLSVSADHRAVIARKNAGGGAESCNNSLEENSSALPPDGDLDLRDDANTYYVGYGSRDATQENDICRIDWYLTDVGDAGTAEINVRCCICERDDGDNNDIEDNGDGLVMDDDCDCSDWVTGNDDWDVTAVTFDFDPAVTIPINTYRYFVLDTNSDVDSDHYFEVEYDTTDTMTLQEGINLWDSSGDNQLDSDNNFFTDIHASP